MKVHEFANWLMDFEDQDAEVEILCVKSNYSTGYDDISVVEFNPKNPDHFDYIDMRDNKFAIGKPYQYRHTLLIGSKE